MYLSSKCVEWNAMNMQSRAVMRLNQQMGEDMPKVRFRCCMLAICIED